jgi:hypothetical protein
MIVHIKLTDHFLEQSRGRMCKRDRHRLTDFLLSPDLPRVAEALEPGKRGAVSIGDGIVVFCRDSHDRSVLAVLTYLSGNEAAVARRRLDTELVSVEIRD